jgi:hypothetical protein
MFARSAVGGRQELSGRGAVRAARAAERVEWAAGAGRARDVRAASVQSPCRRPPRPSAWAASNAGKYRDLPQTHAGAATPSASCAAARHPHLHRTRARADQRAEEAARARSDRPGRAHSPQAACGRSRPYGECRALRVARVPDGPRPSAVTRCLPTARSVLGRLLSPVALAATHSRNRRRRCR